MASYTLIIQDFNERPCDFIGCKELANQYRVIVNNSNAVIKKSCWEHYQEIIES